MEEPKGPTGATVVEVAISSGRYRCYGSFRRRAFRVDLAQALDLADDPDDILNIRRELEAALKQKLGIEVVRLITNQIDIGDS